MKGTDLKIGMFVRLKTWEQLDESYKTKECENSFSLNEDMQGYLGKNVVISGLFEDYFNINNICGYFPIEVIDYVYPDLKVISRDLLNYLWKFDPDFEFTLEMLSSTDQKNYFDFSIADSSKISYLKGDRIPEDKGLIWDKKYRKSKAYHTKIGKLITWDSIEDIEKQKRIQEISKRIHADLNKNCEDRFVIVNDIAEHYLISKYSDKGESSGGSLYGSCMRFDELQEAVSFYDFCEKVKLLVLYDSENKIKGRALVWSVHDSEGDLFIYMDRIYALNDNIKELFIQYAEKNAWLSYDNQDSPKMYIEIDIDYDTKMPYFDTFKYYDGECLNTESGDYCLDNTSGATLAELNPDIEECYGCGVRFDTREEGGYHYQSDRCFCGDCGTYINTGEFLPIEDTICLNGDIYAKDDENIVYSNYFEEYFLFEDCVYSTYHDDYFYEGYAELIFSVREDDWFLKSDIGDSIIEIDGEYYMKHGEHVVFDEETQEYKLIENV